MIKLFSKPADAAPPPLKIPPPMKFSLGEDGLIDGSCPLGYDKYGQEIRYYLIRDIEEHYLESSLKVLYRSEFTYEFEKQLVQNGEMSYRRPDYWLNMLSYACAPNSLAVYRAQSFITPEPYFHLWMGFLAEWKPAPQSHIYADEHVWLATPDGKIVETWDNEKKYPLYFGVNLTAIAQNDPSCPQIKEIMEQAYNSDKYTPTIDSIEALLKEYPNRQLRKVIKKLRKHNQGRM